MTESKNFESLFRELETTDISDDIVRRFEVYEELGFLEKPERLLAIRNLLRQDLSLKLTLYLLEYLVNLGERISDIVIIDCLNSEEPEIREWACILAPHASIDILRDMLTKMVLSVISPDVRVAAAYALGVLGDEGDTAILELVTGLDHEKNRDGIPVSTEASRAIKNIRSKDNFR